MVADRNAQIIEQFKPLLVQYEQLANQSRHDDFSDLPREARVLAARLQAAFQRTVPISSTYAVDAARLRGRQYYEIISDLAALAQGLVDDVEDGRGMSVVELVHADTHADMIEMSHGLLSSGYKDAAAVIIGTALELHLKAMAGAAGIATMDAKGRPVKADTLKAELRKMDTYSVIQDKQITYWLGVRNSAAHGSYDDYGKDDVSGMIDGIATFVDSHPA